MCALAFENGIHWEIVQEIVNFLSQLQPVGGKKETLCRKACPVSQSVTDHKSGLFCCSNSYLIGLTLAQKLPCLQCYYIKGHRSMTWVLRNVTCNCLGMKCQSAHSTIGRLPLPGLGLGAHHGTGYNRNGPRGSAYSARIRMERNGPRGPVYSARLRMDRNGPRGSVYSAMGAMMTNI